MSADLVDDCRRCRALCCVAHAFDASARFGFDKAAGVACRNLRGHECGIHDVLHDAGFSGCAGYSCYGAGPVVAALDVADEGAVFLALRAVFELRQLVRLALARWPSPALDDVDAQLDAVAADVDGLANVDVVALRATVLAALRQLAPRVLALRVLGASLGPPPPPTTTQQEPEQS
jgi:hypothetical protein